VHYNGNVRGNIYEYRGIDYYSLNSGYGDRYNKDEKEGVINHAD